MSAGWAIIFSQSFRIWRANEVAAGDPQISWGTIVGAIMVVGTLKPRGSLSFVGDGDVAPSHGGISAVEYIFSIGGRRAGLTIEIYQQEGRA